jgi:protein SCO1/2
MKNKGLLIFFLLWSSCFAEDVRFEQKLGARLPAETEVINEQGKLTRFGDYIGDKPTILSFAYYGCPNLCTLVLNGLATAVEASGLTPGRDVKLVSVSIDPREKSSLSLAKKRTYLARLGQAGDENPSWHFLTADDTSIQALTKASGFHYKYDPVSEEYNHPSGIIVLSPEGVISRYFFGIQFDPAELKSAIQEAKLGKSHPSLTEVVLNCFHYHPETGRYGAFILKLLQWVSAITITALAILLVRLSTVSKKVAHE